MKFGRASTSTAQARPKLFEPATKEFPIEGREEVPVPKGSATAPPSMLLELKFSWKLRTSGQDQKDYGLPQTSTIEVSTASTIATTATTLRNAFSSETKLRSSSERGGWVNFFDASLNQENGQGCCRNQKRQGRPPHGVIRIIPRRRLVHRRFVVSQRQELVPN
ncbi:hypothetical protein COCNU_scaffold001464G000040 [Cocos nucifera]|nr:hypothetical protein [Cocos nucifera]